MNASPPRPFICGRTTDSTAAIVIAASIALPPRRNTSAPAAAASGWSATTAALEPETSGRICAASSELIAVIAITRISTRPRISHLEKGRLLSNFGYCNRHNTFRTVVLDFIHCIRNRVCLQIAVIEWPQQRLQCRAVGGFIQPQIILIGPEHDRHPVVDRRDGGGRRRRQDGKTV